MPATIIYRPTFPSTTKPVEQSVSIASNGLVTGNATFVTEKDAKPFLAGDTLRANTFTALRGIQLGGLFVETAEYTRQSGLSYCKIEIIGVLREPQIIKTSQFSLRSFSKTEEFVGANAQGQSTTSTAFFSFDYYSESVTWSWISAKGRSMNVSPPTTARFGASFNQRGGGTFTQVVGSGLPPAQGLSALVPARPFYPTTKNEETRGNLIYYSTTIEAIYQ